MTIRELFDFVQEIKPHQYTDSTMLVWLNEIEREIWEYKELYSEATPTPKNFENDLDFDVEVDDEEFTPHTEYTEDLYEDDERLYYYYLMAKVDFMNREFTSYNNNATQHETYFDEWKAKYGREHKTTFRRQILI